MSEKIKIVEPFGLIGPESMIESKNQAEKIIIANSYYIMVSGFLFLAGYFLDISVYIDGLNNIRFLAFGLVYVVLGVVIRQFKSRVASVTSFALYLLIYLYIYFYEGFTGVSLLYFIFVAAAYRSVVASFYYQKNQ